MLERLKWKIFYWFAPKIMKDLRLQIGRVLQEENASEVCISAKSNYQYTVYFNDGPYEGGPFLFHTRIERDAFAAGVDFAMKLVNIDSYDIDQDEADELSDMFSLATHSGGSDTKN